MEVTIDYLKALKFPLFSTGAIFTTYSGVVHLFSDSQKPFVTICFGVSFMGASLLINLIPNKPKEVVEKPTVSVIYLIPNKPKENVQEPTVFAGYTLYPNSIVIQRMLPEVKKDGGEANEPKMGVVATGLVGTDEMTELKKLKVGDKVLLRESGGKRIQDGDNNEFFIFDESDVLAKY